MIYSSQILLRWRMNERFANFRQLPLSDLQFLVSRLRRNVENIEKEANS